MRILLIDDEEVICEIIEVMINTIRPQAEIVTAFDYDSGLNEFRKQKFDFILTDHNLNDNKIGLDLLKEITKIGNPPPACLMSGFLPDLDKFIYGNTFYSIRKPFHDDELEALFNSIADC